MSVERAAVRLKVRMRRQHRIYDPGRPLRLWVVLDESVLHRVVGSPEIMREQLEHLTQHVAAYQRAGPPLHGRRPPGSARTVLPPEVRRQRPGRSGAPGTVH
nr:Scr1 family TA system antitoxin-like transcriptional regulator [Streptomyces sp. me109]